MKTINVFLMIAVLITVLVFVFMNAPSMTRAQNKDPQLIKANEWMACEYGYFTKGSGVSLIEGGAFVISGYASAMLTVNVEVERGEVMARIVGVGEYPIDQIIGTFNREGSAVYPIQNNNDHYIVELMTNQNTIIKLCRISITVYK